jgi:hypothetical protein
MKSLGSLWTLNYITKCILQIHWENFVQFLRISSTRRRLCLGVQLFALAIYNGAYIKGYLRHTNNNATPLKTSTFSLLIHCNH